MWWRRGAALVLAGRAIAHAQLLTQAYAIGRSEAFNERQDLFESRWAESDERHCHRTYVRNAKR